MNSGVKKKWIGEKRSDDNEVTIVEVRRENTEEEVWGVVFILTDATKW